MSGPHGCLITCRVKVRNLEQERKLNVENYNKRRLWPSVCYVLRNSADAPVRVITRTQRGRNITGCPLIGRAERKIANPVIVVACRNHRLVALACLGSVVTPSTSTMPPCQAAILVSE